MIENSDLNPILNNLTNNFSPIQPIVQRGDGLFVFCNNIHPGGTLGTNLSGEYYDSEWETVYITILGTWNYYTYDPSEHRWYAVLI